MHRQVFSHEHAVRHIFDHGRRARAVLEADRIAHFLAEIAAELLGDALRHTHRRDAPRLRAADHAATRQAHLGHVLRHLRRFSRARFSNYH